MHSSLLHIALVLTRSSCVSLLLYAYVLMHLCMCPYAILNLSSSTHAFVLIICCISPYVHVMCVLTLICICPYTFMHVSLHKLRMFLCFDTLLIQRMAKTHSNKRVRYQWYRRRWIGGRHGEIFPRSVLLDSPSLGGASHSCWKLRRALYRGCWGSSQNIHEVSSKQSKTLTSKSNARVNVVLLTSTRLV